MKKVIDKISKEFLENNFPIVGKVPGWYFRVKEVSNNVWEAEGIDDWGRKVSYTGDDPKQLIAKCELAALEINNQITHT